MESTARKICESVSVDIEPGVQFGFPEPRSLLIESPANVRRGIYDVDLIGAFTYLGGRETFIRHVDFIGRFCSIASNVVMGQIEHPTDFLSAHPLFEGSFDWRQLARFRADNAAMIDKAARVAGDRLGARNRKITIGNDVWIGEGVFVRRGVEIGDGAIVASRAVVTSDVPPYAIVGGAPARVIRYRFDDAVIAALRRLQWWQYGTSALGGVDFTDIHQAIDRIDRNITSGIAEPYAGVYVKIDEHRGAGLWRYDAGADRLVRVDEAPGAPVPDRGGGD